MINCIYCIPIESVDILIRVGSISKKYSPKNNKISIENNCRVSSYYIFEYLYIIIQNKGSLTIV